MMASTISARLNLSYPTLLYTPFNTLLEVTRPTRRKSSLYSPFHINIKNSNSNPKLCSDRTVLTRVCGDGGGSGAIDASPQKKNIEETKGSFGDSYVALFVRMLGLDNDPLDREQAIVALWQYSLGGKKCIDNIMQFQGCINLTVNLLQSESSSACEAAAGLLRSISSVNVYRDVVAESGAIEEITGLLNRLSLTPEVMEQILCALWNLSVDEKLSVKIANPDILPLLIKSLEDEDLRVKEAAAGVLANLTLTHSNHTIMVEAGVIPKLANFLKSAVEEESKVIRKEARNALVELSKNEYYRILVIEEGLVPVPLIGIAPYRSLTPSLHSWPSLPDGSKIERTSKGPSRFGASELLLGLNIDDKNANLEEAKMNAIIGRSKQQFLARSGAIEVEDTKLPQSELSKNKQFTLLPWMDGVARLVLILELEDELSICRAAESIARASINEHLRNSFKEAGAVKNLIQLLDHNSDAIIFAAVGALERLSISNAVCQTIEAEGVIAPLTKMLKNLEMSEGMMEKTLNLLARILDPNRKMKSKFYGGPVNGFKKELDAARGDDDPTGSTRKVYEMPKSKQNIRQDVLAFDVVARLVDMLKHPSLEIQRKVASILEFVATSDSVIDKTISADIESGLLAIFQQVELNELESDVESQLLAIQVEEVGLAVSAASRLLTKLLDLEQFRRTINSAHFTKLLHKILKSNIPLQYKDWVAACLVKIDSLYGPISILEFENPINMEVTLYEKIPRLIEQIRSAFSLEAQEAAVVELNRIISEGMVDATRTVASEGGIFLLVKLIEGGSENAVEAALSILYNLSMDSENHAAFIAAGAVPALRKIIMSERSQWKRALRLLRNLPT
ncbi:ARM REPEAT SUPERFAMILY PROTEIN [Salix purpurea]|uniref:ARM REPEAT SUPERFAMILY PROTEIN n=1 Tax=Salix purpurea TaxID=77065 RepID=A0A9Q0TW81_SALPP|nr:ARM REPEAT SUPERFAMILY PROTEIN [Salix purpurea]